MYVAGSTHNCIQHSNFCASSQLNTHCGRCTFKQHCCCSDGVVARALTSYPNVFRSDGLDEAHSPPSSPATRLACRHPVSGSAVVTVVQASESWLRNYA